VTGLAESPAVRDIPSEIGVVLVRLDVVGLEVAATSAAELAGVVVSGQDGPRPVSLFLARARPCSSRPPSFKPSRPSRIVRAAPPLVPGTALPAAVLPELEPRLDGELAAAALTMLEANNIAAPTRMIGTVPHRKVVDRPPADFDHEPRLARERADARPFRWHRSVPDDMVSADETIVFNLHSSDRSTMPRFRSQ